MESILFYIFASLALSAAVCVLVMQRVFYSAVALIICLVSVAGLYMLLQAPFMAAVQVIVYAGAIMVLFLFVIMLLDPFSSGVCPDKGKYLRYLGPLLGLLGLLSIYPMLAAYDLAMAPRSPEIIAGGEATVRELADVLFSQYLLPFEVTSVLILVAIVGAVVLARRQT